MREIIPGGFPVHEWALAEAVIEAIRNEQNRSGQTAVRATIRFGELQSIDQEVFSTGLQQLKEDDPDLTVELLFETEPAAFACSVCATKWKLADCDIDEATQEAIHFLPEVAHSFISCPSCGSADFRVEQGRGISVEEIDFSPGSDS
jgi:hydrogenase nickel incorporation protein HypA/HybF